MTLDRTGEPTERHHCAGGWLGTDDEDRPIPCLICKPHLAVRSTTNDFAERMPSARAQAAIDQENRNA